MIINDNNESAKNGKGTIDSSSKMQVWPSVSRLKLYGQLDTHLEPIK